VSLPPLPASGLASEVLDRLEAPDPSDPRRLVEFVKAVAPPAAAPAVEAEATFHLVTFRLGEELFAVPIEKVVEIVRVQALTRVPQAPEHVRGVQSLRGAILPVFEVRTRLGLPPATVTPESRVLVAEGHSRLLGLLVDAVSQVRRLSRSALQPPPPEVRSRCSDYVVGMVQTEGAMALMLDLDRLLILPTQSNEDSPR
jgi:purine-binding chemotaxis protein CheW